MTFVRSRTFLTGLSAGCLALGIDYLAHALAAIPLLPEQAGYLLIKLLPLSAFSSLLAAFGVLARPMLLLGATVVIIAIFGAAALLAERLVPRFQALALAVAAAIATAIVALVTAAAADALTPLLVEVVIVGGTVPAVYGSVAQLTRSPDVDPERRVLLRNLFYGAVGLAVLGIAYVDVRRFVTAFAMKEGNRATSEVTPVSEFYVVSKNLAGDPVIDTASWRLELPGRSVTYAELGALPAARLELTLECISNEVGGTLISNGVWSGPRLQDVLALTTIPPYSSFMLIESADGYTESFPMTELTPDHLLATHLNGEPLTPAHGFPARFIFPGHYGMKQPKWVTRLKFSSSDQPGYWENNGWDYRAIVKTMSRIDAPSDGSVLPAGSVRFSGIAFSGSRRIGAVQVSWSGGDQWHDATLADEFSPYAWRFWHLDTSLAAGHYQVQVRARDGDGALQPSSPTNPLPNGAAGLHSIVLDLR